MEGLLAAGRLLSLADCTTRSSCNGPAALRPTEEGLCGFAGARADELPLGDLGGMFSDPAAREGRPFCTRCAPVAPSGARGALDKRRFSAGV